MGPDVTKELQSVTRDHGPSPFRFLNFAPHICASLFCKHSPFTYQVQKSDFESLDSSQKVQDLKFGQSDDLITPIGGQVANNDQRIDVALR